MDELWVTDASPVIVLAKVGQAHLLEEQASELFISECAAAVGLPMIGTLGVVLRAKRTGRIDSAAEVMESLRRAEFRIDDQSLRIALASVGEDWPVHQQESR